MASPSIPDIPDLSGLQPSAGLSLPADTSPGAVLFSGTQRRVLGLLFGQPERSFYATELIARAGVGSGGVQRELARLVASGLVTVQPVGNQKHYQANPAAPLFPELCSIVRKTFGLAAPLQQALAPLAGRLALAFVYDAPAPRRDAAPHGVELLLVGDRLDYAEVFDALEPAAQALGRTLHPTLCTPDELRRRRAADDPFLVRVLAQPRIWLVGDAQALDDTL